MFIHSLIKKKEKEVLPVTMDTNNEEETTVSSSEDPNASKEEEEPKMVIAESENNNEEEKADTSSKNDDDVQPLLEQSVILEGKRSRKPTLRLEISEPTPVKKDLLIPQVTLILSKQKITFLFIYQGHGTPLGEIEYSK